MNLRMPVHRFVTVLLCLAWPMSAHAHMQWSSDAVAILMAALAFPIVLVCAVVFPITAGAKWFWVGLCLVLYPVQVFLAAIVGGVLTFGAVEYIGQAYVGTFCVLAMWAALVLHLRHHRMPVGAGLPADVAARVAIFFAVLWVCGLAGTLVRLRGSEPGFRLLVCFALVANCAAAYAVWRRVRAVSRASAGTGLRS